MWLWVPVGPETKTDCAGEDQQQFTLPTSWVPTIIAVATVTEVYIVTDLLKSFLGNGSVNTDRAVA
jgi:hypothetical protein